MNNLTFFRFDSHGHLAPRIFGWFWSQIRVKQVRNKIVFALIPFWFWENTRKGTMELRKFYKNFWVYGRWKLIEHLSVVIFMSNGAFWTIKMFLNYYIYWWKILETTKHVPRVMPVYMVMWSLGLIRRADVVYSYSQRELKANYKSFSKIVGYGWKLQSNLFEKKLLLMASGVACCFLWDYANVFNRRFRRRFAVIEQNCCLQFG